MSQKLSQLLIIALVGAAVIVLISLGLESVINNLDAMLVPCQHGTSYNKATASCNCMNTPFKGKYCGECDCAHGQCMVGGTTPKAGSLYGCRCPISTKRFGHKCQLCYAENTTSCKGVCQNGFYGAVCDKTCKANIVQSDLFASTLSADALVCRNIRDNGGTCNYCSGHGLCDATGNCDCEKNYFNGPNGGCSQTCAIADNGKICSGHGVCEKIAGVPTCACEYGWRGTDCSVPCPGMEVNGVPCSGHGQCLVNYTGTPTTSCNCNQKFRGDACEIECPGEIVACSGHGTCDDVGVCACNSPAGGVTWVGEACSCSDFITCSGNGNCMGNAQCQCIGNWDGEHCRQCKENYYGSNCQFYCDSDGPPSQDGIGCYGRGTCTVLDFGKREEHVKCECFGEIKVFDDGKITTHFSNYEPLDNCQDCAAGYVPKITAVDQYGLPDGVKVPCELFCSSQTCNNLGDCNEDWGIPDETLCKCHHGPDNRKHLDDNNFCLSCETGWFPEDIRSEHGCSNFCTPDIADTPYSGNFPAICATGVVDCVQCSGHGTCGPRGACLCEDGYTGVECDIQCTGANGLTCSGHGECKVNHLQALMQFEYEFVGNSGALYSCECNPQDPYTDDERKDFRLRVAKGEVNGTLEDPPVKTFYGEMCEYNCNAPPWAQSEVCNGFGDCEINKIQDPNGGYASCTSDDDCKTNNAIQAILSGSADWSAEKGPFCHKADSPPGCTTSNFTNDDCFYILSLQRPVKARSKECMRDESCRSFLDTMDWHVWCNDIQSSQSPFNTCSSDWEAYCELNKAGQTIPSYCVDHVNQLQMDTLTVDYQLNYCYEKDKSKYPFKVTEAYRANKSSELHDFIAEQFEQFSIKYPNLSMDARQFCAAYLSVYDVEVSHIRTDQLYICNNRIQHTDNCSTEALALDTVWKPFYVDCDGQQTQYTTLEEAIDNRHEGCIVVEEVVDVDNATLSNLYSVKSQMGGHCVDNNDCASNECYEGTCCAAGTNTTNIEKCRPKTNLKRYLTGIGQLTSSALCQLYGESEADLEWKYSGNWNSDPAGCFIEGGNKVYYNVVGNSNPCSANDICIRNDGDEATYYEPDGITCLPGAKKDYVTATSGMPDTSMTLSACKAYGLSLGKWNVDSFTNNERPSGCFLHTPSGKYYFNAQSNTVSCSDTYPCVKPICTYDGYTFDTISSSPTDMTEAQCHRYANSIEATFGTNTGNPGPGCVVTADKAHVRYNPGVCQHPTAYYQSNSGAPDLSVSKSECEDYKGSGWSSLTYSSTRPSGCYKVSGSIYYNHEMNNVTCSSTATCIQRHTPYYESSSGEAPDMSMSEAQCQQYGESIGKWAYSYDWTDASGCVQLNDGRIYYNKRTTGTNYCSSTVRCVQKVAACTCSTSNTCVGPEYCNGESHWLDNVGCVNAEVGEACSKDTGCQSEACIGGFCAFRKTPNCAQIDLQVTNGVPDRSLSEAECKAWAEIDARWHSANSWDTFVTGCFIYSANDLVYYNRNINPTSVTNECSNSNICLQKGSYKTVTSGAPDGRVSEAECSALLPYGGAFGATSGTFPVGCIKTSTTYYYNPDVAGDAGTACGSSGYNCVQNAGKCLQCIEDATLTNTFCQPNVCPPGKLFVTDKGCVDRPSDALENQVQLLLEKTCSNAESIFPMCQLPTDACNVNGISACNDGDSCYTFEGDAICSTLGVLNATCKFGLEVVPLSFSTYKCVANFTVDNTCLEAARDMNWFTYCKDSNAVLFHDNFGADAIQENEQPARISLEEHQRHGDLLSFWVKTNSMIRSSASISIKSGSNEIFRIFLHQGQIQLNAIDTLQSCPVDQPTCNDDFMYNINQWLNVKVSIDYSLTSSSVTLHYNGKTKTDGFLCSGCGSVNSISDIFIEPGSADTYYDEIVFSKAINDPSVVSTCSNYNYCDFDVDYRDKCIDLLTNVKYPATVEPQHDIVDTCEHRKEQKKFVGITTTIDVLQGMDALNWTGFCKFQEELNEDIVCGTLDYTALESYPTECEPWITPVDTSRSCVVTNLQHNWVSQCQSVDDAFVPANMKTECTPACYEHFINYDRCDVRDTIFSSNTAIPLSVSGCNSINWLNWCNDVAQNKHPGVCSAVECDCSSQQGMTGDSCDLFCNIAADGSPCGIDSGAGVCQYTKEQQDQLAQGPFPNELIELIGECECFVSEGTSNCDQECAACVNTTYGDLASGAVLEFGNNGFDSYTYNGEDDPEIEVCSNAPITFKRTSPGHPLRVIKESDCAQCKYNSWSNVPTSTCPGWSDVTDASEFTYTFTEDGTYYYVCTSHENMVGRIIVRPCGGQIGQCDASRGLCQCLPPFVIERHVNYETWKGEVRRRLERRYDIPVSLLNIPPNYIEVASGAPDGSVTEAECRHYAGDNWGAYQDPPNAQYSSDIHQSGCIQLSGGIYYNHNMDSTLDCTRDGKPCIQKGDTEAYDKAQEDIFRIRLMQGREAFTRYYLDTSTTEENWKTVYDAWKADPSQYQCAGKPCDFHDTVLLGNLHDSSWNYNYDCAKECPEVDPETKIPCSGHGRCAITGSCVCDPAKVIRGTDAATGSTFQINIFGGETIENSEFMVSKLDQTGYRGENCNLTCPGYHPERQDMTEVCSGHGVCNLEAECQCDIGYTGEICQFTCPGFNEGDLNICAGHGTCGMSQVQIYRDIFAEFDETFYINGIEATRKTNEQPACPLPASKSVGLGYSVINDIGFLDLTKIYMLRETSLCASPSIEPCKKWKDYQNLYYVNRHPFTIDDYTKPTGCIVDGNTIMFNDRTTDVTCENGCLCEGVEEVPGVISIHDYMGKEGGFYEISSGAPDLSVSKSECEDYKGSGWSSLTYSSTRPSGCYKVSGIIYYNHEMNNVACSSTATCIQQTFGYEPLTEWDGYIFKDGTNGYTFDTTSYLPPTMTEAQCHRYANSIGASWGINTNNPGPGCVRTSNYAHVRYNPGACDSSCGCSSSNICVGEEYHPLAEYECYFYADKVLLQPYIEVQSGLPSMEVTREECQRYVAENYGSSMYEDADDSAVAKGCVTIMNGNVVQKVVYNTNVNSVACSSTKRCVEKPYERIGSSTKPSGCLKIGDTIKFNFAANSVGCGGGYSNICIEKEIKQVDPVVIYHRQIGFNYSENVGRYQTGDLVWTGKYLFEEVSSGTPDLSVSEAECKEYGESIGQWGGVVSYTGEIKGCYYITEPNISPKVWYNTDSSSVAECNLGRRACIQRGGKEYVSNVIAGPANESVIIDICDKDPDCGGYYAIIPDTPGTYMAVSKFNNALVEDRTEAYRLVGLETECTGELNKVIHEKITGKPDMNKGSITNAECRLIAERAGKEYSTDYYSGDPTGCFLFTDGKIYFNQQSTTVECSASKLCYETITRRKREIGAEFYEVDFGLPDGSVSQEDCARYAASNGVTLSMDDTMANPAGCFAQNNAVYYNVNMDSSISCGVYSISMCVRKREVFFTPYTPANKDVDLNSCAEVCRITDQCAFYTVESNKCYMYDGCTELATGTDEIYQLQSPEDGRVFMHMTKLPPTLCMSENGARFDDKTQAPVIRTINILTANCTGDQIWSAFADKCVDFSYNPRFDATFFLDKGTTQEKQLPVQCQITSNNTARCALCTCFSDFIYGQWAGFTCDTCNVGFGNSQCRQICPGFDGDNMASMCGGNGACLFGSEVNAENGERLFQQANCVCGQDNQYAERQPESEIYSTYPSTGGIAGDGSIVGYYYFTPVPYTINYPSRFDAQNACNRFNDLDNIDRGGFCFGVYRKYISVEAVSPEVFLAMGFVGGSYTLYGKYWEKEAISGFSRFYNFKRLELYNALEGLPVAKDCKDILSIRSDGFDTCNHFATEDIDPSCTTCEEGWTGKNCRTVCSKCLLGGGCAGVPSESTSSACVCPAGAGALWEHQCCPTGFMVADKTTWQGKSQSDVNAIRLSLTYDSSTTNELDASYYCKTCPGISHEDWMSPDALYKVCSGPTRGTCQPVPGKLELACDCKMNSVTKNRWLGRACACDESINIPYSTDSMTAESTDYGCLLPTNGNGMCPSGSTVNLFFNPPNIYGQDATYIVGETYGSPFLGVFAGQTFAIKKVICSQSSPCHTGEGHCENDEECAGTLKCFIRNDGEEKLSFNAEKITYDMNYCYHDDETMVGCHPTDFENYLATREYHKQFYYDAASAEFKQPALGEYVPYSQDANLAMVIHQQAFTCPKGRYGLTVPDRVEYKYEATGQVCQGTQSLMYNGASDNPGSADTQLRRCFEACLNQRTPLSGSWTYIAKSFYIQNDGRCWCNENDVSTCTRDNDANYNLYSIITEGEWNVCEKCQPGKFQSSKGSVGWVKVRSGPASATVTKEECRTYADWHGLTWGGETYTHNAEPYGCLGWYGTSVYFNNNQNSPGDCAYSHSSLNWCLVYGGGLGIVKDGDNGLGKHPNCQNCPAGKFGGPIGSWAADLCEVCEPGTKQNAAATGCEDCPAGKYELGGLCLQCPNGQFSPQKHPGTVEQPCKNCPTGSDTNGQIGTPGTTDSVCRTCPAGKANGVPGNDCIDCGVGKYTSTTGNDQCFSCGIQKFAHVPGMTACKTCGVDSPYSGLYGHTNNRDTCVQCNLGEYVSTSTGACTDCAKGYDQPLNNYQTSCAICEVGRYGDVVGLSDCKYCSSGKYQSEQGKFDCDKCVPGTYSNQNGRSSCTQCELGKYQNLEGRTSCTSCPKGMNQNQLGMTSCKDCQEGYYADQTGLANCKGCAGGKYQKAGNTVGQIAESSCHTCECGYYCVGTSRGSCGGGTFSGTGQSSCTPVSEHYYATGANNCGQTRTCMSTIFAGAQGQCGSSSKCICNNKSPMGSQVRSPCEAYPLYWESDYEWVEVCTSTWDPLLNPKSCSCGTSCGYNPYCTTCGHSRCYADGAVCGCTYSCSCSTCSTCVGWPFYECGWPYYDCSCSTCRHSYDCIGITCPYSSGHTSCYGTNFGSPKTCTAGVCCGYAGGYVTNCVDEKRFYLYSQTC